MTNTAEATYNGVPISVGEHIKSPAHVKNLWGVDSCSISEIRPKTLVIMAVFFGRALPVEIPRDDVRDAPPPPPPPAVPVVAPPRYDGEDAYLAETAKYVDVTMDALTDIRDFPDHKNEELYADWAWVRLKGTFAEPLRFEGVDLDARVVVNCLAVKMPILVVHECVLHAHQAASTFHTKRLGRSTKRYVSLQDYKSLFPKLTKKELGHTLWGVRGDDPSTLRRCMKYLGPDDDATIGESDLLEAFFDERLLLLSQTLQPVKHIRRRNLLAVPLVPVRADVRIWEWGFFE